MWSTDFLTFVGCFPGIQSHCPTVGCLIATLARHRYVPIPVRSVVVISIILNHHDCYLVCNRFKRPIFLFPPRVRRSGGSLKYDGPAKLDFSFMSNGEDEGIPDELYEVPLDYPFIH